MLRVPFALSRSGKFGQEQFCRSCPGGWKRGEADNRIACKQCVIGETAKIGAMTCMSCSEGRYGSQPGICTGCNDGQYSDVKKSLECKGTFPFLYSFNNILKHIHTVSHLFYFISWLLAVVLLKVVYMVNSSSRK